MSHDTDQTRAPSEPGIYEFNGKKWKTLVRFDRSQIVEPGTPVTIPRGDARDLADLLTALFHDRRPDIEHRRIHELRMHLQEALRDG